MSIAFDKTGVAINPHTNKEGYLVMANVVLPIRPDERFIPPDLERPMAYFSNFLIHTKFKWTPEEYLSTLIWAVAKYCGNGYRGKEEKIRDELVSYFRGTDIMFKFFMNQF